jgi:hypothetical protein
MLKGFMPPDSRRSEFAVQSINERGVRSNNVGGAEKGRQKEPSMRRNLGRSSNDKSPTLDCTCRSRRRQQCVAEEREFVLQTWNRWAIA